MTRLIKIDTQTYRLGNKVIFKTDRGDWQMGQPLEQEEPLEGGFIAGTVSHHAKLKDAKRLFHAERRRMSR